MKYILEVADNQSIIAEEFFKSVKFVKKVKAIMPNEITNSTILQSIEDYEKRSKLPTILNLDDLKAFAYARNSFDAKSLARYGLVGKKTTLKPSKKSTNC